MRLAVIQPLITFDKTLNVANAISKIKEAAENGADIAVLPECFNCLYGPSKIKFKIFKVK